MAVDFDINNDLKDFIVGVQDFGIDDVFNLHFSKDELYVLFKTSIFVSNCLTDYMKCNSIDLVTGSKLDRFFELLGDSIMKIGYFLD